MATAYKILGQVSPTLNTETPLYVAPTGSAIISTLIICNTNTLQQTFRVSVSANGVSTTTKDYIYKDILIAGNDTFAATLGITLSSNDTIRVYASANNVAFSCFGQENT